MPEQRHARPARAELLAVILLVALALALRAWGAGFSLPFTYHPDEHQYVDTAVAVLGGQLDPGRFNNPTLLKYVLAVPLAAWLVVERAAGRVGSVADFQALIAANPTTAYLLGRLTVAVLGALTVAAVWALGRAAYGRRVALASAIVFTPLFLHVRESHFAVSDVPMTLLVTLALLASVRIQSRGLVRDYVLAGVLVGMAAGTKYSGAMAAVAVAAAHLLADGSPLSAAPRRLLDRRLLLCALTAVLAFLAAVPLALLRWPAFVADVSLLLERGRVGFKGLALASQPGWRFYLSTLRWGAGLPLAVLSAAAVALGLAGRRRVDWVLAVYVLLAYAQLARQLLLFERFLLPILPALVVLGVAVADRGLVSLLGAASDRRRAAALGVVLAVVVVPSLASTLRFDWLLRQTDTRSLAKAWIEANLPAGARLVVQSNGPELSGGGTVAPLSTRVFDLETVGTTGIEDRPLDRYVADGVDYVVLSSFSTDRHMLDHEEEARRRAYFAAMDARFSRVAQFRPRRGSATHPFLFAEVYGPAVDLWRLERPGPTVTVYRVSSQ